MPLRLLTNAGRAPRLLEGLVHGLSSTNQLWLPIVPMPPKPPQSNTEAEDDTVACVVEGFECKGAAKRTRTILRLGKVLPSDFSDYWCAARERVVA